MSQFEEWLADAEARLESSARKLAEMKRHLTEPPLKRELHVEIGPAQKTKLYRADPKLLANKVRASFAILTDPKKTNNSDEGASSADARDESRQLDLQLSHPNAKGTDRYPDDLRSLVHWNQGTLFSPQSRHFGASHVYVIAQIKSFLDHCPPEERPSGPAVDFLLSDDCERDVQRRPSQPEGWEFHIYAPSADEAEQRAVTLLQLIDSGVRRPLQRHHLAQGEKAWEASKEMMQEVVKQAAALKQEYEKLAKPSEISADILSQLKAQKVMVAVELAGLNARVKACDDMLKDPKKLEISALQSISDMKVKAEIERVGIREKLEQINAYIGEGEKRQATQGTVDSLRNKYEKQLQAVRNGLSHVEKMTRLYDLYAAIPLQDDRITISPVEWTN